MANLLFSVIDQVYTHHLLEPFYALDVKTVTTLTSFRRVSYGTEVAVSYEAIIAILSLLEERYMVYRCGGHYHTSLLFSLTL